jgi:hypothetical protein
MLLAAAMFNLASGRAKVCLLDTLRDDNAYRKDKDAATNTLAMSTFKLQRDSHNDWCYASLDDVKGNFRNAGLLNDNIMFIKVTLLLTLGAQAFRNGSRPFDWIPTG